MAAIAQTCDDLNEEETGVEYVVGDERLDDADHDDDHEPGVHGAEHGGHRQLCLLLTRVAHPAGTQTEA